MPEAPECRIFTDNLSKSFDNQSLHSINVIGGRYLKQGINRFDSLKFPLNNVKFNCKGKFIYWQTDDQNMNLCFTLGMTGAFGPKSKHSALDFKFDNGNIFFNDPRRFGTFRIFNQRELNEKLNSLGWDILQEEMPNNIIDQVRKFENKSVAELLMNQKIQAGVGNYIKCEACYMAKILPMVQVRHLSDNEIIRLYKAIKNIARISYEQGGATIRDFADMYGNIGKFFDKFQVYGKKIDPLGNPVDRIITKDKRSSYYVKNIQI